MPTQTQDPFVLKVTTRLDHLDGERRELFEKFAVVRLQLEQIDAEEARLKTTLDGYLQFMDPGNYSSLTAPTPAALANGEGRLPHRPMRRGAYAPLAYQALVELAGEASLGEIVDYLRKFGRISESKNSYYSTRSALNRHDRIEKTPTGFRLKGLDALRADPNRFRSTPSEPRSDEEARC